MTAPQNPRRYRLRGTPITNCPHVERRHMARGMCNTCYQLDRRTRLGERSPGPPKKPKSIQERMFGKFLIGDGCWVWTANKTPGGYGTIGAGGRRGTMLYAHRVMYEWFVGPIPDDLEIDHLCRNQSCVRPDHLEAVTHAENMRRRPR